MHWIRVYPRKLFWRLYWICLVASLILDLIWLYRNTLHYHFGFQYLIEFFAIFGFLGCMLLILIAKGLGLFIVVDEDYYQRRSGGKS